METESIDPGLRARNLRTLALLASLFLVPLALAFCTYYGSAWRPGRTVNHGVLITPARPLPATALAPVADASAAAAPAELLRGQWSLVYVGSGACDAQCRQALFVMRSARLALNSDMGRVAQVFLVVGECCAANLAQQYPGVHLLDARGGDAAAALLREFPEDERAHTLFVVDPLGNLMMRYDARENSRGLLEDLQKLLRLSHIG
jgi:cytochrome oxidase Cu insertion factor (SCO1/SenC/PrrC family)